MIMPKTTLACVYAMLNIQTWVFMRNILTAFQMNEAFGKVIMQDDVSGCVIFIYVIK